MKTINKKGLGSVGWLLVGIVFLLAITSITFLVVLGSADTYGVTVNSPVVNSTQYSLQLNETFTLINNWRTEIQNAGILGTLQFFNPSLTLPIMVSSSDLVSEWITMSFKSIFPNAEIADTLGTIILLIIALIIVGAIAAMMFGREP